MSSALRAINAITIWHTISNGKQSIQTYSLRHLPLNISKRYSSHIIQDGRPFRMAILGSGPAGFYTAYKVMSSIENAKIDMYERLPVPFGLVRFGVAPDHPQVKVSDGMVIPLTVVTLWH